MPMLNAHVRVRGKPGRISGQPALPASRIMHARQKPVQRHSAKRPQAASPHHISNKGERTDLIRPAQRAQELRQFQDGAATDQICCIIRCHGKPIVATFAGQNRPHAIKAGAAGERQIRRLPRARGSARRPLP